MCKICAKTLVLIAERGLIPEHLLEQVYTEAEARVEAENKSKLIIIENYNETQSIFIGQIRASSIEESEALARAYSEAVITEIKANITNKNKSN